MRVAKAPVSLDDYVAGERDGQIRHEYVDGEVYAMTGASREHTDIVANILVKARPRGRERGCSVLMVDMRVYVPAYNNSYYPDVVGTCDPADREASFLRSPCFIVEVLSPSTAHIDRREKRLAYATLESLRQYVLVAQDRRRVEVYVRDGNGWSGVVHTGDSAIRLECLDLALSLDEIYEGVEFPPFVAEPDAPAYA